MQHFTKTLLTSLALTLGACDAGPDDAFGAGDIELRPGGLGGFNLNTSFIGGHDQSELDLRGKVHKYTRLAQVCLANKDVCFNPEKDVLYVDKSQIQGERLGQHYEGTAFNNSNWYLEIDYDQDGVMDSTITTVLIKANKNHTTQTAITYWDYYWSYDSKSATGKITKHIDQRDGLTPMCQKDEDTGSLGSIVLGDSTIDTSPATDGVVYKQENSMFIACHSSATGKLPTWGYVHHDLGHQGYTGAIRIVRADYCNDGQSWTEPGQKLAVTDSRVISDQFDPALAVEGLASFDAGWLCVDNPRLADLADVQAACAVPKCEKEYLGAMGSDIMTQLP